MTGTLVRWPRSGRNDVTYWHVETPTLNDEIGRTGCGKRFRRAGAERLPVARWDAGALCRSCLKALGGDVPGDAA